MGASQVMCLLQGANDFEVLETRPVVVTSVVVADRTGVARGVVLLTDCEGSTTHMQLNVPVGNTVVWADRVALPVGLGVMCLAGTVAVTVAYE